MRKLLILLLIPLIVTSCRDDDADVDIQQLVSENYLVYLPYVSYPDPCVNREKFGISWFGNEAQMESICASTKYNAFTLPYMYDLWPGKKNLAIMFSDSHVDPPSGTRTDFFARFMRYYQPLDWDKEMLVLNEPDRWDQANRSPAEAAVIFYAYERMCPNCKIVGPNISPLGIGWFIEFISEYERLYGERPRPWRFAIHFYADPVFSLDIIDNFCDVLDTLDYDDCRTHGIWVTEFGVLGDYPNKDELTAILTDQLLNDDRVEKAFFFTWDINDISPGYMDVVRPDWEIEPTPYPYP